MKRSILAALLLCACGPRPLLENVPRPDPAVAAAIAVGAAAAATAADPQGGTRQKEAARVEPEARLPRNRETIPGDVLDRLDQAERGEPVAP
jgi:hypothetical protein